MIAYQYEGGELETFEHATNWKRYIARQLGPYIAGRVLEVGSGLGATTRLLCDGRHTEWTCLEPDARLVEDMRQRLEKKPLPVPVVVHQTTLAKLPANRCFDTILYIDVLEHIEDDRGELAHAAERLKVGGRVVVLAPAHQCLYTPFDRAIGHFRRYSTASLRAVTPKTLQPERFFYLDSVGMLASATNRLFLHSSQPTLRQVLFWDRVLVNGSKVIDPILGNRVGKSVIGVWRINS